MNRCKWGLIAALSGLVLAACGGPTPDESDPAGFGKTSVRVSLTEPEASTSRSERFRGTFSEVQSVWLLVQNQNGDNASFDNLTRVNNIWAGVLDNISLGGSYDFLAEAHDSGDPTFGDNSTLLFRGQLDNFQINSAEVQLPIRLSPFEPDSSKGILIPRITRILYKPNVQANESQQVVVDVQASVGDNLSWNFSNGSFSPYSGNYVASGETSSFSSTLTGGGTYLRVSVTNQLNYKVTTSFSVTDGTSVDIQPSLVFNPVILSIEGQREAGDNVSFEVVVTDDGPLGNLSDNWSFLSKNFTINDASYQGDNVTFSAILEGYNPSENGTLTLQITGNDGDNLTVEWPIPVNAFPSPALQQISPLSAGLTRLATGLNHSCRLDNNGLNCWGDNRERQIDNASIDNYTIPKQPAGLPAVSSVTAADNVTCVLFDNRSASCWGSGLGATPQTLTELDNTSLVSALQVDAGGTEVCALRDNGTALCWDWGTAQKISPVDFRNAVQISVGDNGSCAVLDNGSINCDPQAATPPDSIQGHVIQASVGRNHACAVLDNRSVTCWGDNSTGQLGNGQSMNLGAEYVSAGDAFSCAVVEGGKLRCWGANASGQLGAMASNDYANPIPRPVYGGINNAVEVSTGGTHACALLQDNSTRCWGRNHVGQLGDETQTDKFYPVPQTP